MNSTKNLMDYKLAMPRFEDLSDAHDFMDGEFFDLDDGIVDAFQLTCQEINCGSINNMKLEMLMKPKIKKDALANWLFNAFDLLKRSRLALRTADNTIDNLRKEICADKTTITTLQNEIIQSKTEQLNQVSSTVQREMKSYCDIVKENCKKTAVSPQKLKDIVKTVSEEEDRSKNLVVFGFKEEEEEDVRAIVSDLLECTGEKPKVNECRRVGSAADKMVIRPIKIKLNSSDAAYQVLRNSSKLKRDDRFKTTYISPDRSQEEQARHRKLMVSVGIPGCICRAACILYNV